MKLERAEPVQLMYSLSVKKLRGLTHKRLGKALSVVHPIRRNGFRGRVSEVRILPGPLLVFRTVVVRTDLSFSHSYVVCPWKPLLCPLSYRPTIMCRPRSPPTSSMYLVQVMSSQEREEFVRRSKGEGAIYRRKTGAKKGLWVAEYSVGKKRRYFYGKTKKAVADSLGRGSP